MNTDPSSRQSPGHDGPHENRGEPTGWKESIAGVASQATDAAKAIRSVGAQVGTTVSGLTDAGSDLATSAKEQAKTFASELEAMARRNPLGTIAGAVAVGVVIGMMARGRR